MKIARLIHNPEVCLTDGTIEETTLKTMRTYGEGSVTFTAAVPGFSRYGLRRSW